MAISCTEALTGSGSGLVNGRIGLAPTFTPAASLAYNELSAFGLEVTSLHVHLVAPDGSTRDTSIAFPIALQTLEVELAVPLRTTGQTFRADLQLLNSDGQVLFSGSQLVVATAPNQPGGPPVVVDLQYTGPGAAAKSVTVTPASPILVGPLSLPVTALANDAGGANIADVIVRWTTSDATLATVTPTSNSTATVASAGKRGTVTISAITPLGVTGTAKVTLVPVASRLVVISGGAQSAGAGTVGAQPIVVEVQAADGLPVPGVPVTFRAVTAGGVVATTTTTSDASGRASTTFTVGQTAGVYQFEVASGSLPPVTVSATATPAPAATLVIVGGNFQSGTAGTTLPQALVVRVVNRFGAPVGGATVQWSTVSGLGTPSPSTTTTAADGTASISYTLGNRVQTESVRAALPGVAGPSGEVFFSVGAVASPPDALSGTGGGQHAPVGTPLPNPLVVNVIDALGNPVSGAKVTWSVAPGSTASASFSPAISITDVAGNGSTIVTLGGTPGPLTITAAVAGLTINFTATADPGSTSNSPGTLSGFVFDAVSGAALSGASVTVFQGNQTVAGVTTGRSGTYTTSQLAAGTYRVTITDTGYTTVVITSLTINGNTQAPAIPMVPSSTQLGSIAGTVFDATNNRPVTTQVTLELRAGVNTTTGTPIQTVTTSSASTYLFSNVAAGTYTVVARATGFAVATKTGISVGGSTTSNQDIFMSPTGSAGNVRIVLTWRSTPRDLDSYLTGPQASGGRFFVYYGSPGDCANPPYACLDVDVTNGNGPETITITQMLAGSYRYTVNNYSGSPPLDQSGARVDVYINNSLAQTFSVPSGSGDNWTVFDLSGTTITPINTISSGQITSRIANGGGLSPSRIPTGSAAVSSVRNDNALIAAAIRRHPKRHASTR